MVDERVWEQIKIWLQKHTKEFNKITLLGSGGNINKLIKLSKVKEGKPLSLISLNVIYKELEACQKL